MTIIDRIKYDGTSNGLQWLIYKFPSEQFVLGSQLIVNQGQEALFIKGGEILDLFGPGTYTLTTLNLPILNKLVNFAFGGKTPFTAEIYFINTTVNLDMKWGTTTPIPIEDAKYGLILNVSARGQYGINIIDSRLFVSRIIGAVQKGTITNQLVILRYFNGLINAKIKSTTAEYMIRKRISFLEISQYLSELSDVFKEAINDEFVRFGIEIVNFYCEAIAPKKEEYEKFRNDKEKIAIGKDFYIEDRTFDLLEKIVENHMSIDSANTSINVVRQMENILLGKTQNVNNKNNKQVICQKCGAMNRLEMKFCERCGNEFVVNSICKHCGTYIYSGMKFCGNCGQKL